jgi:ABC-2 type transport system permease protein
MKYVRIFLLHFQEVTEFKARSFVWFLDTVIPSGILLLFWIGALASQKGNIAGWTLSSITSYYFLLSVMSSLLIVHIEEDLARVDIAEGRLSQYLIRPFSYFWSKFFEEIPWRILQGVYAISMCAIFVIFFGKFFTFTNNLSLFFLACIIAIFAYWISFIFKMIVGIIAFWTIDIDGLRQLVEVILMIFGGFVLPLSLMPSFLSSLASYLPFSYIVYYPIIAFQGQLSFPQVFQVMGMQIMWIVLLGICYRFLFSLGIRKFSGVGQ